MHEKLALLDFFSSNKLSNIEHFRIPTKTMPWKSHSIWVWLILMASKIEVNWTINFFLVFYNFQFIEFTKVNLSIYAIWQFWPLLVNVLHLHLIFFINTLLVLRRNFSQLTFIADFFDYVHFIIYIKLSIYNYTHHTMKILHGPYLSRLTY